MDAETVRDAPPLAEDAAGAVARPARSPRPDKDPKADKDPKPDKDLGPLTMIWAAARVYPGRVATALVALSVTAAATLGIPWGFRHIIDQGFARGSDHATINHWFETLLAIILVLAI